MNNENNPVVSQQEKYFLNTFPLISAITKNKLNFSAYRKAIDDIIQNTALKLLEWKSRRAESEYSEKEWKNIAYTATINEIKTFYFNKFRREVSFSELEEVEKNFPENNSQQPKPEGETNYESVTILLQIWKKFQTLSYRQKYAFLFCKDEFILHLLKYGCCSPKEIADSLALGESEFVILLGKLPLKDTDIQNLLAKKLGENLSLKQVWMARGKAKNNLRKSLKD